MAKPMSSPLGAPPYPQSPVIDTLPALICLALNVFLPGVGTIAAGVLGENPLIGRGIAQLLLAIILVGWVWAIVTGIQTLHNAVWRERHALPARAA